MGRLDVVSDDDQATVAFAAPEGDAPAGSMLSALRGRAAALGQARSIDLPIGGTFGEDLVVRYGYLTLGDLDRYGQIEPGKLQATGMTMDMLAAAARTVLFRHEGELVNLEVGLDGELWAMLGRPLPPGVTDPDVMPVPDVVFGLFDNNPLALVAHGERLLSWMQNPDDNEDLGESSAATS